MKLNLLTQSISLALIAAASQTTTAANIEIDDQCSLVEAIQAANNDAVVGGCEAGDGADVITFIEPNNVVNLIQAFGPSQIDDNDTALPTITSHITIEGNGLTLNKSDVDSRFRLMEVRGTNSGSSQTASLHLKNTTVTGGNAALASSRPQAGALFTFRAGLHLENCKFIKNNNAVYIASAGNAIIENSVFRDNKTIDPLKSSTMAIRRSNVTINNSSFVNNRRTYVTYAYSTNFPRGEGTIDIYASNVNISNSTISGNYNENTAAVVVNSGRTTRAPEQTSPILGNTTKGQGSDYQVVISNSTITDNTSNIAAGLFSSTLSEYGSLQLSGNIISGNVARSLPATRNLFTNSSNDNSLYLDGQNLFGEYGDAGVTGISLGKSDQVLQTSSADLLYPLIASNGQFVHPLKTGSVAIDAAPASCSDLLTDQEGSPRALDGNGDGVAACDLGAVEKSADIVVGENCSLDDAILAANTDTAVGDCQAGLGGDVIQLPRGSEIILNAVAATLGGHVFGLPLIQSGVVLAGNRSTISRANDAPDFGIFGVGSGGDLALIDSEISGGRGDFGGLFSEGGSLTVLNSTLTNTSGVALLNSYGAKLRIENSTINNNNIPQGPLTVDIGNGAIQTDHVRILQSAFHDNTGGKGAALDLRNNAYNSLENSTISSNTSNGSSAFVIEGAANINGLTVTNNAAVSDSGGVYIKTLPRDANFSQNQDVKIRNSIFSGNTLQTTTRQGDSLTTELFNVENGGSGVTLFNNILGQNSVAGVGLIEVDVNSIIPTTGVETVIGPLQFNGGLGLSHAPVVGSVAIDNGPDDCFLVRDQANHIRPFDGDADGDERCDIGAIELGSFNPDDLIFKNGFDD